MQNERVTLTDFLARQLRETASDPGRADLGILLDEIAQTVRAISAMVGKGALGEHREAIGRADGEGKTSQPLELAVHDVFVAMCERSAHVAGFASASMDAVRATPVAGARGAYLVVFDPLDSGAHGDLNVATGTIFSVLRRHARQRVTDAAFLRAGGEQLAAGYAIYGPSTVLILTVGSGTHGFTLDRDAGAFFLTHPSICLPAQAAECSIDSANERFWEPPVLRYVRECRAGSTGERQQDFTTRWVASTVADVHRVLMHGGVYVHPGACRQSLPSRRGRLLHEANPMALLVEQAGGVASTGRARILELVPASLHERRAVILGSPGEVERLERYHREYDSGADTPFISPLFNERSLFRPEARA